MKPITFLGREYHIEGVLALAFTIALMIAIKKFLPTLEHGDQILAALGAFALLLTRGLVGKKVDEKKVDDTTGLPPAAGAAILLLGLSAFLADRYDTRYHAGTAAVAGCAAAGPIVRAILSAAEGGCVLFHEEIEDEDALRKACRIVDEKKDAVHDLVSVRREAAGMRKAALARDAGAGR